MIQKTKNCIRISFGLIISAVLIIIAFYNINFERLFRELASVSILAVASCVFFMFLNSFFRTLMWKVTTGGFGQLKFTDLFGGVMTGLLVNNFLPLRAGDFYRSYYLAKKNNLSNTSVLSTVLIERIFDVLSLSVLLGIGIIAGINELKGPRSNYLLILVLILLVCGILAILYIKQISAIIQKSHFLPEKIKVFLTKIIGPFVTLKNRKSLFLLIVYSLCIWASIYGSLLSILYYTGDMRFQCSFVVLIFLFLGLLIPSSPGALGIVQLAFWIALRNFGIGKEQAISYSIMYHGIYYLYTIAVGFPFLLKSNIKITDDTTRSES